MIGSKEKGRRKAGMKKGGRSIFRMIRSEERMGEARSNGNMEKSRKKERRTKEYFKVDYRYKTGMSLLTERVHE